MKVRVDVIGGLRVRHGTRTTTKFRTQQVAGLLAYLACHRASPTSRDTLVDVLWPDGESATTRHRLSQALSSLRDVLEPEKGARGKRIHADRDAIHLAPSVETDLDAFERAIEAAEAATTTLDRNRHLDTAIALYQGELLPQRFELWVHGRRETLKGAVQHALGARGRAARDAGDDSLALSLAARAAGLDPFDEVAYATWIRLLMEHGSEDQAVREYREFERRLESELGVAPDPETAAIVSRVAAPPTAPRPARRAGLEFPDGATLTIVAIRLNDTRDEDAVHDVVKAVWGRIVLERRDDGVCLLGFLRVPEALAAVGAFRTATQHRKQAEAASIALGVLDATFRGGRFSGSGLGDIVTLLDVTRPGCTVARSLVLTFVDEATSHDVRDLGGFDLGGAAPVELVLLSALSRESDDVPVTAPRPFRTNVSRARSRFFGRTSELAMLRDIVEEGHSLVTLLGPGGTGKTRLAREIALVSQADLPGGAWMARLDAIYDVDRLLPAVCDSLGVPVSAGSDPLDAIAAHVGDRPSLLILDNLEQLLPGAQPIVDALCDRLASAVVLVTSRRVLGSEGERVVSLNPLPLPTSSDEDGSESPSVQLFVDRASARRPDFELNARNRREVNELVRHLDGLPLALELAASRVAAFSPSEILKRLKRRSALDGGGEDLPLRHRTMVDAIEWSYRLLDKPAQKLFLSLAAFRGSFSLAAVEAVTDSDVAGDALADLVDSSLVVSEGPNEPRFHLLETMRDYAAHRQPRAHAMRVGDRHAVHFGQFAAHHCPALTTSESAPALLALDQDAPNIAKALEHWSHEAQGARTKRRRVEARTAGLVLADLISEYWSTRGRARDAIEVFGTLLADTDGLPPELAAKGMFQAGAFAQQISNFDVADRYLADAAERFEVVGNRDYLARTLQSRGIIAHDQLRLDESDVFHGRALAIQREIGNQRPIAHSLQNLGNNHLARGEFAKAREAFEESLAIKREVGTKRELVTSIMRLGNVAENMGDLSASRAYHEECVRLSREIGDERYLGVSMSNLGSIVAKLGELDAGIDLLVESGGILHRVGAEAFAVGCIVMIAALPKIETYAAWVTPLAAAGVKHMAEMGVELPPGQIEQLAEVRDRLRERLGDEYFQSLTDDGMSLSLEHTFQHAALPRE